MMYFLLYALLFIAPPLLIAINKGQSAFNICFILFFSIFVVPPILFFQVIGGWGGQNSNLGIIVLGVTIVSIPYIFAFIKIDDKN